VGGPSCSKHEPRKQFGVATEAGLAALRAWCQGELQRHELVRGDLDPRAARHLEPRAARHLDVVERDKIEYNCIQPNHPERPGSVFLDIDPHTGRPLFMSLKTRSLRELDALAPTLLFPVFDSDHHRAYEAMRHYIGSEEAVASAHRDAYETQRDWTRGKTYLRINRLPSGTILFGLGVMN
jgi:hypothetical protein